MSRLMHIINRLIPRKDSLLTQYFGNSWGGVSLSCLDFASVIFANICEILTDLVNDVTLTLRKGDVSVFAEFKVFFNLYGQLVLNKLYKDGFVVIGHDAICFRVLNDNEYMVKSLPNGSTKVLSTIESVEVYVMRSSTYEFYQKSDAQILASVLRFLNNVLNSSNTISERLGALVVASPKNLNNAPTATVLTKEQKKSLEEELQKEYGSLSNQKSIMVLPREMQFATISLASLDIKTTEKAKLAILAICDRIKVPANQVAIIDSNSSKSLANGGEMKEGDFAKYQSFERLLNRTFIRMAEEIGLSVDYEIYNKPVRGN